MRLQTSTPKQQAYKFACLSRSASPKGHCSGVCAGFGLRMNICGHSVGRSSASPSFLIPTLLNHSPLINIPASNYLYSQSNSLHTHPPPPVPGSPRLTPRRVSHLLQGTDRPGRTTSFHILSQAFLLAGFSGNCLRELDTKFSKLSTRATQPAIQCLF